MIYTGSKNYWYNLLIFKFNSILQLILFQLIAFSETFIILFINQISDFFMAWLRLFSIIYCDENTFLTISSLYLEVTDHALTE